MIIRNLTLSTPRGNLDQNDSKYARFRRLAEYWGNEKEPLLSGHNTWSFFKKKAQIHPNFTYLYFSKIMILNIISTIYINHSLTNVSSFCFSRCKRKLEYRNQKQSS